MGQISNQSSTSKLPGEGTPLNKAVLWAAPELETFLLASTITTWSSLLTQESMAQFQAPLRVSNFKHLLMFVDSPEGSWPKRSPRQPRENRYKTLQIITGPGRREERRLKREKWKGEEADFQLNCLKHLFTSSASITSFYYALGSSNRPIPSTQIGSS